MYTYIRVITLIRKLTRANLLFLREPFARRYLGAHVKRSTGHTHTHTTAEHTTAEQTTHTNTKRATAQRRLIVEVVVAALKIVVGGKCQELESRFQVRFPGIDFYCDS